MDWGTGTFMPPVCALCLGIMQALDFIGGGAIEQKMRSLSKGDGQSIAGICPDLINKVIHSFCG